MRSNVQFQMTFDLFFWKVLGSAEKNVIIIKKLTMEGLNNMGVMDIENFNEDYITTELINTGSCPRILVSLNDIMHLNLLKSLLMVLIS